MTTKDMNTPSEYSKFPTRKSAHKWAMENLNLDSQGRYRIHEMPTCYGTYSNWYVYYKLGQLKTG